MAFPKHMHATECRIVGRIIRTALDQGMVISVYDGEEWALGRSTDYEKITHEVNATDLTQLRFRSGSDDKQLGDIILIHGNEEDVIHDHSDTETMERLCAQ